MSPVLRLTTIILLGSGLTVTTARLIGQSAQVEIVTDYVMIEDHVYAVLIRDPIHNIYSPLAGKGCFEAPPLDPEWIAVRQQYQTNYVEQFQVISDFSPAMVERIKCRAETIPGITVKGQESFR